MYGFIGGKKKILGLLSGLILGVFVCLFLSVLGLLGSIGSEYISTDFSALRFLELREPFEGSRSFYAFADTSAADVVINEVRYNGSSKYEFVELYNSGNSAVNLNGWRITDASGSEDTLPDMDIQPNRFVVIVAETSDIALHTDADSKTLIVHVNGYIGKQLNNDGDRVIISDSGGNSVAQMSYGSDTEFCNPNCLSVDAGQSLERIPLGTGDFTTQENPTPGVGVTDVEDTGDLEGSEETDGDGDSSSDEDGTDEGSEEAELTVSFSAPSEVSLGEEFEVEVSLENAVSGRSYLVKFGANDGSLDYGQFSKGYTWSDSLDKFLPFSGGGYSWGDFPSVGSGGGTIRARIATSALAGDCAAMVRVRDSEEEENYDSGVKMIRANEAPEESDEEEDDDSESDGGNGSDDSEEDGGEVLGETSGSRSSSSKKVGPSSGKVQPYQAQATMSPILSATSAAGHEATPSTESAFSTPSGEEGSSKFSIIPKILLALGGLVILGVLGFSIAKKRGLV